MDMTSNAKQQGKDGTTAPDASGIDELMQANIVRVFNERDPDRRRMALSELYSEGAVLYDPETVATGWARSRKPLKSCSSGCRPTSCSPRPDMLWATTAPRDSSGVRVRLMAPWP